ncbi:MAG: hypothetical protein IKN58_05125 [Prevotella sp.]|nr:hypothetical protein [Prevotella sp.]
MIRRPETFEEEKQRLLEKWYNEENELDFPEYLEKHLSETSRKYWLQRREYRRKMMEKGICV